MLVEEVYVVRPQPAERALYGLADVRRAAVHARDAAVLYPEAELGGDDDAVAMDSRSSRSSAVPYAWLMPIRPRPSAETVRPWAPSVRVESMSGGW